MHKYISKDKAVPLQAWKGPEVSRKLRLPDFVTTAQDGGKVISLRHRPLLPPGSSPGTHFYSMLSRTQGHSAIGRIFHSLLRAVHGPLLPHMLPGLAHSTVMNAGMFIINWNLIPSLLKTYEI